LSPFFTHRRSATKEWGRLERGSVDLPAQPMSAQLLDLGEKSSAQACLIFSKHVGVGDWKSVLGGAEA